MKVRIHTFSIAETYPSDNAEARTCERRARGPVEAASLNGVTSSLLPFSVRIGRFFRVMPDSIAYHAIDARGTGSHMELIQRPHSGAGLSSAVEHLGTQTVIPESPTRITRALHVPNLLKVLREGRRVVVMDRIRI
jgi:hypothetical protein